MRGSAIGVDLRLAARDSSKSATRKTQQPFTLAHWRAWASDLILDSGDSFDPEPWQDAFVEDVFSGCPECWLVVPEGNGKTTLIAGLSLYHAEHRPQASVPIAASSREQAEIMYRQAEGFVLRSERLYEPVHSALQAAKGKRKTEIPRFVCLEGYRRINHFAGGRIQVFAADDRTGDGVIPTLGIIDELHRHRNLSLYRIWAGKLSKRKGQIVTISTAGEPGSEFETTRERIRQSAIDINRQPTFLRAASPALILHEWAVPEKGNVEDFNLVKAANPFSGITAQTLKDKYSSPSMTVPHWRRFVCNLPTRSEFAAIQEAEWYGARSKEQIPEGVPIWVGLDVAWKWDTTAAVPLWWKDVHHRLFGPARILTPPRDGTSLDIYQVQRALQELHDRNPIHTVVMDSSRAEDLMQWIQNELGAVVIDRTQTPLSRVLDYEKFMEALRNGWLKHAGDVEFTRHVLNAVARPMPGGAISFDRPSQTRQGGEQDRRVIDALTAAAMVNAEAANEPPPDEEVHFLSL